MKNTNSTQYTLLENFTVTYVFPESNIVPSAFLQRFHIAMTGVWYLICATGVCTNFLNLRTFAIMGLEDSVTVSFFCLSISDFSICSVATVEMGSFFMYVLEKEFQWYLYLPALIPTFYMTCVRRMFNVTTISITTFLAVQRCVCIVLPFHVKGIFTRFRTIIFMVFILSFSATCSGLYMWRHRVTVAFNPFHNASQKQVIIPVGSEPYIFIFEVFLGLAFNLGCQAIVVICLIVMGVKLKQSRKFRESSSIQVTAVKATEAEKDEDKTKDTSTTKMKVKPKETQALIQVSLVSAIFIMTNAPYLGFGVVNTFVSEFGVNGAYQNLFHLVLNCMFTAELINSSINILVYYKYNSKFRISFPLWKK